MINPRPADYQPAPLIEPGHSFGSITDKISGSIRWLVQPNQGAFAFDTNLNITGGITGMTFTQFGTGPDGALIIWDSMQSEGTPSMYKVPYNIGVGPPGARDRLPNLLADARQALATE